VHEILIILFVAIAGAFNGAMDTIDMKFDRSVFSRTKGKLYIWLRSNASDKPKSGWRSWGLFSFTWDGWHFSKQAMLLFFFLAFGWAGYFAVFEWWVFVAASGAWWIMHSWFFGPVLVLKKLINNF